MRAKGIVSQSGPAGRDARVGLPAEQAGGDAREVDGRDPVAPDQNVEAVEACGARAQ
ncbi:MAG: hypothetical protein ACRD0K_18660 [Egibacteraceae bacterium]